MKQEIRYAAFNDTIGLPDELKDHWLFRDPIHIEYNPEYMKVWLTDGNRFRDATREDSNGRPLMVDEIAGRPVSLVMRKQTITYSEWEDVDAENSDSQDGNAHN